VIGVDNIAESSHYWPPLTTVDQPLQEAGALAVDAIDLVLSQPEPDEESGAEPVLPSGALLQPTLIVRESTRSGAGA
jgi:DNA-binding LacI/PurR family transcriptional regulator